MGTPLRACLTTALLCTAAGLLQAEDIGTWSGMLGAVKPMGGSKAWVGSSVGPSIDIMETYSMGASDAIRMRFGYWDLKGSRTATVSMSRPTTASIPATGTDELFGFSYGAEYVRYLPGRAYLLGGLGVTYISATRTGAFDLTTVGLGHYNGSYGANNFVPYFCFGAGYQFTQSLALEARFQNSTMKPQSRPIELSTPTNPPVSSTGQGNFGTLNTPTLTIGLNLTF